MSDLQSVLPNNATKLEKALEQTLRSAVSLPVTFGTFWNPDTCPEEHLIWLAWALSVDFWDAKWSVEAKRAVLRDAVRLHRLKGTLGAVKRALASAGYGDARVEERFAHERYDGEHVYDGAIDYETADHWAEYRVFLSGPISFAQAAQVRDILSTIAPARCHLKELNFEEALNLYDGKITYDGTFPYGVA